MSRGAADAQPGTIYHLISQFVAKEWFIATNRERRGYLWLLGSMMALTDWRCFSYAIMSSHIHLGVLAGNDPLVDWMAPMHSDFARWINEQHERPGAVFVRGPETVAFVPGSTSALINYIHSNPVRASVVTHARDSDWTSHRAYVGLSRRPSWLDVDLGLSLAGFANGEGLDAWMTKVRIEKAQLDTLRVSPKRGRGRPAKVYPMPPIVL